jgi:hypothetical protein
MQWAEKYGEKEVCNAIETHHDRNEIFISPIIQVCDAFQVQDRVQEDKY